MTRSENKVLLYAPNWLGDSIMALPAVAALKRRDAGCRIVVLSRSSVGAVWSLLEAVDSCVSVETGIAGALRSASRVRAAQVDCAYILPNSFRSGLIPFLARVPRRIGLPGHGRSWMLSGVVSLSAAALAAHQSREYAEILGVDADRLSLPELKLPDDVVARCLARLGGDRDAMRVALVPGAARGPSKRWPAEHFAAVGRHLTSALGAQCVVLGTRDERQLCETVRDAAGGESVCLAGETDLLEFAAALQLCRLAVTNDSGGMHLAAAVGTTVVVVYGRTDPAKTGPLGDGHVILQQSSRRSRDIARDSADAAESMRGVTPQQVCEAVESKVT